MQHPAQSKQGFALVVLASLGWSLSGLFVRLLPGLDGWQINCWRGFWLALTLLVYLTLKHRSGLGLAFGQVPRFALFVSAVCFAFGTTCYVTSLTLIDTATVATIGATAPLITALLSLRLTGEKPTALNWLAGVLALVGMVVVVKQSSSIGSSWGILLAMGVPITFALQTLLLRRYRAFDLMTAICLGGFLSFVIAAFASLIFSTKSAFMLDGNEMALLFLMGVIQLGLPLIFYGWGAKSLPAVMLAVIATLDAAFNPLWAWTFAGEVPSLNTILGAAIILSAVMLSVIGGQRKGFGPVQT